MPFRHKSWTFSLTLGQQTKKHKTSNPRFTIYNLLFAEIKKTGFVDCGDICRWRWVFSVVEVLLRRTTRGANIFAIFLLSGWNFQMSHLFNSSPSPWNQSPNTTYFFISFVIFKFIICKMIKTEWRHKIRTAFISPWIIAASWGLQDHRPLTVTVSTVAVVARCIDHHYHKQHEDQ